MCNNKNERKIEIALYWDHSHIWGFLVWHSLSSLSIPFKLLTAKDLLESEMDFSLIIVPGGSARAKAGSLGKEGQEKIRQFIENGGKYLGFCGGAGFALTADEGLNICEWKRSSISDRLLHHISGHLFVEMGDNELIPYATNEKALVPVWFPGRFAAKESENIQVLLRYIKPSSDFYMSDLPLTLFDEEYQEESIDLYGASLDPKVANEPVTIKGKYGKGEYILSYAHLETPASAFANRFYFNILEYFTSISIKETIVPNLELDSLTVLWQDEDLDTCCLKLQHLMNLALELNLLFSRTSWLDGWKQGMQGVQFANLKMALFLLRSIEPNKAMRERWQEERNEFLELFDLFLYAAKSWLYSKRLCLSMPHLISENMLKDQQNRLFGKAMEFGGICGKLVMKLEEVFLLQREKS